MAYSQRLILQKSSTQSVQIKTLSAHSVQMKTLSSHPVQRLHSVQTKDTCFFSARAVVEARGVNEMHCVENCGRQPTSAGCVSYVHTVCEWSVSMSVSH